VEGLTEGFTYVDIYANEGPSFLLIVGYLVLLIFFARTLFAGSDKTGKGTGEDGH
jgi:hypothetical protein